MAKIDWLDAWQTGNIGFHKSEIHPDLIKDFPNLNLKPGSRILVPLCGKSLDMLWLNQQGFKVTGIELSPIACESFFKENNLLFTITQQEKFTRYSNNDIEILCGNIFDLNRDLISFQAIYDRAALYALSAPIRRKYAKQLIKIAEPGTTMLLITFEADDEREGPPFPVFEDEIGNLFGDNFSIAQLKKEPIGELSTTLLQKGYSIAYATVYLLKN